MLRTGDLRTKGRSEDVVNLVLSKPGLFGEVIAAMLDDDSGIRMRASDAAEKISRVHPAWLKPHKKLIITTIADVGQQEVRWHAAQILPRLELSSDERRKVVALLKSYLSDDSRIVKTFAMQGLADIALQDGTYLKEVRALIETLTRSGSPAMKARGKKLLSKLKQGKT
jgi:hypothetical protein